MTFVANSFKPHSSNRNYILAFQTPKFETLSSLSWSLRPVVAIPAKTQKLINKLKSPLFPVTLPLLFTLPQEMHKLASRCPSPANTLPSAAYYDYSINLPDVLLRELAHKMQPLHLELADLANSYSLLPLEISDLHQKIRNWKPSEKDGNSSLVCFSLLVPTQIYNWNPRCKTFAPKFTQRIN